MVTDQEAEEIVLLSQLAGISEKEAAHALGIVDTSMTFDFDIWSWEATLQIVKAKERLDEEYKKTHS
jgi:hypothetical protein